MDKRAPARYNLANADDFNCEGTTKQTNKIINIEPTTLRLRIVKSLLPILRMATSGKKIGNDAQVIANQLLDRATADAM